MLHVHLKMGGKLNLLVLAASTADGLKAHYLDFGLFKPIQNVQQAGCNPLLGGLPFEKAHCPVAVIEKPGMADANVIKWLAVERKYDAVCMAYIQAWAQWAQTELTA